MWDWKISQFRDKRGKTEYEPKCSFFTFCIVLTNLFKECLLLRRKTQATYFGKAGGRFVELIAHPNIIISLEYETFHFQSWVWPYAFPNFYSLLLILLLLWKQVIPLSKSPHRLLTSFRIFVWEQHLWNHEKHKKSCYFEYGFARNICQMLESGAQNAGKRFKKSCSGDINLQSQPCDGPG